MKPDKKDTHTTNLITLLENLFPLRFPLARITKLPGIGKLLYLMMFRHNNITCIPKDAIVEIPINKKITPPNQYILPSQIVHRLIDNATSHFIMDFCLCREAMQCIHYPITLGCLFLGEAVHEINPSYGHLVSKHQAHAHVEHCREAGLIHIIGRDKLDETWLQVSSGEHLLTICNCCECCCLWKMLPYLNTDINTTFKKIPGITITVTEECTGCGACLDACFLEKLSIQQGNLHIPEDCRCCGRCAERCPQDAIKLTITDPNFIQKTINRIEQAVDVT